MEGSGGVRNIPWPAMLGLGRGVSGRLSQSLTSRCMRWRRRSVGKIPLSPFRASATTNSQFPSLLNNMDFQVIKINGIHKIILIKSRLCMLLKFCDRYIQPDRLAQIKLIADFLQRIENLCVRVSSESSQITVSQRIRLSLNSFPHNRNIVFLLF